uniref:acylsugar acyltransferase 3-like n=1 Tax=Erigeron canadensis TaxID=72917 RepID=UPI001CB98B35|nr:acylsugar acyltransferase 3-like [Erigeron canadensis]
MIIEKLFIRLGRRKFHTIISREIIKPSSPTPSHLQTYNLSILDQTGRPSIYSPLILFYPNNGITQRFTLEDKVKLLKKSLSQSLEQYYPFAGRLHTHTTPYVDCNDEGIVFLEARNDSHMESFQNIKEHDESLDRLFADNMVCFNSPGNTSLLGVQVNHFACGGLGVAVSMSHAIGDACTLGSFVSYWASMARYNSNDHEEVRPLNPHFIRHPRKIVDSEPEYRDINQGYEICVTRKFMFSNTKLSDLKNKVADESSPRIINPTRVEVLTSLLYKTAVAAATAKSGSFKPSYLSMPVNLRNTFVPKLPQTTVGNIFTHIMVMSTPTNETSLSVVVDEIQKEKVQVERVQSFPQAAERHESLLSKLRNEELDFRSYWCSSVCGLSYNKVDFGWGNAMGATFAIRSMSMRGFLLGDTPDGNGIEALVILEKEDMDIFENDKEMLSFCQIKQV